MHIDLLGAVVADTADHQYCRKSSKHRHRNSDRQGHITGDIIRPDPDGSCKQTCSHRTCQAKKYRIVRFSIKSGQAQGCTGHIQECHHPAYFAEIRQQPTEHQHSRRDTKSHKIRQAVVLHAKFTLGIGEPRNAAVKRIQHARDENRNRRVLKRTAHGGDNGKKT